MAFGDAGTSSLTDGTLAFRTRRVAADSGPGGFGRALEIGFDVNRDGSIDVFVGVNNSGSKTEIGIYDAGTGANNSPSTTSISATPTYVYAETAANYNWAAVTTTNDPSVGTSTDIDGAEGA